MSKFTLKNVRLSFPSLFNKAVFNGTETKFEATFLLNKEEHAETIKQLQAQIAEMIKTTFKGAKLSPEKIALRDGDLSDYDGYSGCMSIKASNSKRPLVIDRDKTPLTEADGKPYSGGYCNAIIELWAQDNQYGRRINANLLGVQHFADGEPFASGAAASMDDFSAFEDSDDPFA